MTVPRVANDWNDELSVTQPGDDGRGGPLMLLLGAMGTTFGRLHDVVRDQLDGSLGWTQMLSPSRAPGWALPWLAQFAGVTLTPGLSEAEQRAQITSPPSFLRGTKTAIVAAIKLTLSGSDAAKRVTIYERVGGDPYALLAITYQAQTPDANATAKAAASQKPLGLLLTVRNDRGWSVGQFEAAYTGRTVADAEADFATVDLLETRLPT